MNFPAQITTLKNSWNGYSTKKKWLIAGAGLLLLAGIDNLNHENGPASHRGYGAPRAGYMANNGQAGYMQANGQTGGAGNYAVAGATYGAGSGAGTYNHPDTTDITSSFNYLNAVEDETSHNFQNEQLDQTDVQNVQTGEVTNGVSNTYADPAIGSGAYEAVPSTPVAEPAAAPADDSN